MTAKAGTGPRVVQLIVAGAGAYSLIHFAYSGIWWPLTAPKIGQVMEEAAPILTFIQNGLPVHLTNPRQYGPTFFFVLHPLLLLTNGNENALAQWLYAIQLISVAVAFVSCALTLDRWTANKPRPAFMPWPYAYLILLALLWTNFSPLYYLMSVKNVEVWELALMSAGLYCYSTERRFATGMCLAFAALTKMLPFVFFLYFLIVDRRTFVYCCLSVFMILTVSHVLYGAEMGYLYLPFMIKASMGQTWALDFHENVSIKGMIVKAFGNFQIKTEYQSVVDPGRLAIANTIGHVVQLIGLIGMVVTLLRLQVKQIDRAERVLWGWSLTTVLMLVLSPQTAFEYMVLSLPAFSYVVVKLASAGGTAGRSTWLSFLAAMFFVANVIPRTIINRILPLAALNEWTGNGTVLGPSEAYQYYGFPLVGLLALLAVLWMMRPRWAGPAQLAGATP